MAADDLSPDDPLERHDTLPAPPPVPSSIPPSVPGQDAAELEAILRAATLPPPTLDGRDTTPD